MCCRVGGPKGAVLQSGVPKGAVLQSKGVSRRGVSHRKGACPEDLEEDSKEWFCVEFAHSGVPHRVFPQAHQLGF